MSDIDFGCDVFDNGSRKKYNGLNPAFVEWVWAKRRAEAEKEAKKKRDAERIKILKIRDNDERIIINEPDPLLMPMDAAKKAVELGFDSVKGARETVAALYGVDVGGMNRAGRAHKIIAPRHAAILAIKLKWPDASLPFISKFFEVDHTTVLHVLRKHGIDTSGAKGKK